METVPALAGRRALVTGGTRGIGLAVARSLADAGARVIVASRGLPSLDQTKTGPSKINVVSAGPGDSVEFQPERVLRIDVTDPASIEQALREAAVHFALADPVEILVNAAGDSASAPLHRTTDEIWNRMIAVNLTGPFRMMKAVVPGMVARGWGRVVTIASTAGRTGAPYIAAYAASKHGVVGLTRSVALEVASKGVTVNAVCPGYVDTDMTRRTLENISRATGRTHEEALSAIVSQNPEGRLVTPGEVAALVLSLCLPDSGAINGQAIVVDGGALQR